MLAPVHTFTCGTISVCKRIEKRDTTKRKDSQALIFKDQVNPKILGLGQNEKFDGLNRDPKTLGGLSKPKFTMRLRTLSRKLKFHVQDYRLGKILRRHNDLCMVFQKDVTQFYNKNIKHFTIFINNFMLQRIS